jgi:uncharacterized membrane protein YphA (DoxX/SURF4 family)
MNHPSAGFFTRAARATLVIIMAGAIEKARRLQWDFVVTDAFPMGGMEFQVLMLALSGFFLLRGAPAVEMTTIARASHVGVEA